MHRNIGLGPGTGRLAIIVILIIAVRRRYEYDIDGVLSLRLVQLSSGVVEDVHECVTVCGGLAENIHPVQYLQTTDGYRHVFDLRSQNGH